MNDSNLHFSTLGLYSLVAEHWSCKSSVVSSNLTGGKNIFFMFHISTYILIQHIPLHCLYN